MNFLAHSFLSFSTEQLVGNMIADFLKNREVKTLPIEIQKGIRLHREIDTFTDIHPVIHQAKKIFSPKVRLYAGAFVDVSFDYFLANDSKIKSEQEWREHSKKVYEILEEYSQILPEQFKVVLQKIKQDDWLYNYRNERGIEFSFRNVINKARYLDKDIEVFPLFLQHKEELREYYDKFFKDIKAFSENYNEKILLTME